MNEIYISTDVETDGPIPGPHSILSFGSAAYTADKELIQHLHRQPGDAGRRHCPSGHRRLVGHPA